MLKPLLMRVSQKLELAIIFSLVIINMVMTILRTVYSVDIQLSRFPDQNILWCFLQPTVAVIVCALPCYRGMLTRKRTEALRQSQTSSEAEFADIWQRYLLSIGEQKDAARTREKELESGTFSGSGSTRTSTRGSELFKV